MVEGLTASLLLLRTPAAQGASSAATTSPLIAFIQVDSAQPNLYVVKSVRPDGTDLKTLYSTNVAGVSVGNLRLSADRTRILLSNSVNGANRQVVLINSDGSGLQVLQSSTNTFMAGTGYGTGSSWLDASTYLFTNGPAGSCHIYRDILSGGATSLHINEAVVAAPAATNCVSNPELSPDGARILFMNYEVGPNNFHYLWTINSDGVTGPVNLGVTTYNSNPRYSPDGGKIAYNRFSGTWAAFSANSDGTAQTDLSAFFGGGFLCWYDSASAMYFDSASRQLRRRNLDGSNILPVLTLGATESVLDADFR